MSLISAIASAVPDLSPLQRNDHDGLQDLLGGLLGHAKDACASAEALSSSPLGEAAVAAGACAVAGTVAATTAAAGAIAAGFAVSGPIAAAAVVTCTAFAAAPVLAAAAAVPAATEAAAQGLETAHDALSPLLPSPQRATAQGLAGLLDLLDAMRGEQRNPLLLPEPLRSMISTAAAQ
jgi:hypothetical protein